MTGVKTASGRIRGNRPEPVNDNFAALSTLAGLGDDITAIVRRHGAAAIASAVVDVGMRKRELTAIAKTLSALHAFKMELKKLELAA